MTEWARIALALLATWRLTHLLVHEAGPARAFERLRAWGGAGFWGRLLSCFLCTSVWVAAPLALFVTAEPVAWFVTWLGLSGGAILLDRLASDPLTFESPTDDELLRTESPPD